MLFRESANSEKFTPVEVASESAFIGTAVVSAVHTLDSNNVVGIPGVDYIPLEDHSTSIFGGMLATLVADQAMERVASYADDHNKPNAARRIRKIGAATAAASAFAAQVVIETQPRLGYGDKLDILYGTAAAIPGILYSRAMTKRVKQLKAKKQLLDEIW